MTSTNHPPPSPLRELREGRFTPGPWKWWTSCSWRRLSSAARGHDKDGGVLCPTVSRSDGHPDVIISEADMALIGAAPDLYQALYMQVANCPICKGDGVTDQTAEHILEIGGLKQGEKTDCPRCREGRLALTKAQGGRS